MWTGAPEETCRKGLMEVSAEVLLKWAVLISYTFIDGKDMRPTRWIVPASFSFIWYINNALLLDGDETPGMISSSYPIHNDISFAQTVSPRSQSKVTLHGTIPIRALWNNDKVKKLYASCSCEHTFPNNGITSESDGKMFFNSTSKSPIFKK